MSKVLCLQMQWSFYFLVLIRQDHFINQRRKDIHENDGKHHSFHVAGKDSDQQGQNPQPNAVDPFSFFGKRASNRIGSHKKGTEEQSAGQKLKPGCGE